VVKEDVEYELVECIGVLVGSVVAAVRDPFWGDLCLGPGNVFANELERC
jgi:hypothetical protein